MGVRVRIMVISKSIASLRTVLKTKRRSETANFLRDANGNVAMLTAFLLLPMLVLLGGGFDIVRATTASSQLRTSLESAALASASLTNSGDVQSIIDDYMAVNLADGSVLTATPTVTFSSSSALNSKTVNISATATVDTFFLKLIGIDTLPVTASTTANQSATNVELSLVLDISSSMKGAKVASLKSAAKNFVDQILNDQNITRTSMNLIPFGGTVNIDSMFNSYVVTSGASGVIEDPTEAQYDTGSGTNVLNGSFRFSVGDNCIEYRYSDFDDSSVLPANARGQVPHFWRWNNFNPWCPESFSSVLLNTNNVTNLKNKIEGMTLSDGTGMDIGTMWGYKTLSPTWKGLLGGDFADRPDNLNDDTQKVLVIMTDGAITAQDRPEDWSLLNTHTNRPTNNPTTQQQGNQGNNNNKQVVLSKGNASTLPSANQAVGQFKRICDAAQADGIVVYTIGFQISAGSLPESMLQYCASDPSKYYLVESLDIQSAFDSIAASVNALRITG